MTETRRLNLLLDSRLVQATDNARLAMGTVRKHPRNPLFTEDAWADPPRRWEMRLDNLYPSVIRDPESGLFRAWYFSFISQELAAATPPAQRPGLVYRGSGSEEEGLLYAESTDGLEWIRPEVGLIDFEGSKANNLVMRTQTHGIHAGGVLRDDLDPDPARRYKCLFRNRSHRKMAVSFSPDGLRWSDPVLWPEHDAVGDSHNNAFWAPELGRYVGITRGWTERPYHGLRTVLRTESMDFVHWSEPVEVMRGRNAHDQPYSMPVTHHGDVYLGLPAMFHKGDADAIDWDTVTTELAWSPDTVDWHRVCPGEPFIPTGPGEYPTGAYDCGCVYAAAPITVGDTTLIYYGGSNGLHNGWREGSFNLATLGRDRFAGFSPEDETRPGRVTTTLLTAEGPGLTLNADVRAGGSVRVAVTDPDGTALPGMTLDDCATIGAGGLDLGVRWGSATLDRLAGSPMRLVFEITNATLYAFAGASRVHADG